MNTMAAVALALASVLAYAAAAAVQHRVATTRPARLLASGGWWGAVALNTGGAALHVAALRFGPLTLVQPIGALTLVAGVPLAARIAGRRVTRNEWRGVAWTLVGFGALLPLTASGAGAARTLGTTAALAATAATGVVVLLLLSAPGRALGYAAASGVTSAVASTLTQTVLHSGLSTQTALVATMMSGLAVGGLVLSQSAYTGGGLGAPLAVLTLANPVVSAGIGLTLLGEQVRGGTAGTLAAVLGAAVATRGIALLCRCAHRDTGGAVPSRAEDAAATPL